MDQEYGIRLEEIKNLSLFQNALNVYALWPSKDLGNIDFKNGYTFKVVTNFKRT